MVADVAEIVSSSLAEDPIERAWIDAWTPPDRRGTRVFAENEVEIAGDYSVTGRFKIGFSTFLTFPLECLDNDVTRMVNILKAPRTAGSLVGDIFFQDIHANKPAPTMATFQTDDDAERHYLTKVAPTLKATERNAKNHALTEKKRELYRAPHFNYYYQGANKNNLQGKGVKNEINDEVWLWQQGLLKQAFTRTKDFKRVCKILNISQAGLVKTDWYNVYHQGKRYDYGARCFKCQHHQPYDFFLRMLDGSDKPAGIVWDKDARLPDGRWDIPRCMETTKFRCRSCGHDHDNNQRTYERFAQEAAYICHDPDRSAVNISIRWTAMVGGDWHLLTQTFLLACEIRDDSGATDELQRFYMQECAQFWDPVLGQKKNILQTGEYRMDPWNAPGYKTERLPWEKYRFITADYQQGTGNDNRHLLVTVRAWSDAVENRSRLLWWGRCNTFADLYKLQLAFEVTSACVAIDGAWEMNEVAAQCIKYGGWSMLIGDDPDTWIHRPKNKKKKARRRPYSPPFYPDPHKGKAGAGKAAAWAMFWSNPTIKNQLWNLRHALTRHRWELPADLPPEYRDGIDSEMKKWEVKKGNTVPEPVWRKIKAYNHPWDCECMQTVLAVFVGCLGFDIEEDKKAPELPNPEGAEKETAPKKDPDAITAPKKDPDAITAPHEEPDQLELLPT
jgi:hypothetical protein